LGGHQTPYGLLFKDEDVTFHRDVTKMSFPSINIKTVATEELLEILVREGLKRYRANQIYKWLYTHHARSFEEMTNISKAERELLSRIFYISDPHIVRTETASDGTRKFLFQLEDGHTIESVLIPDEDRQTLCISSQIGCQQACRFCLTGSSGFTRNLESFEITDQVLEISRLLDRETQGITNIVFMGMGEPLANFEEVVKALKMISGENGLGLSPRRVTVSTDGLAPEIVKLGKCGVKVNLAVSLNATTDDVRNIIMPVNRRYPIKVLLNACKRFPLESRRRITFEYVMLKGVNDSSDDALRLTKLLRGIRCKVNLIPFNPFPGSEFARPDDGVVRRFQKILLEHHYTAPIRESRGRDISAACGQLREKDVAEKMAEYK
jgi:23S rRNA (adenine2503-C2)-methyltransferase